ncbi:hypothetical protein [Staphylococcus succinus]|nr:hypothetical protein [Staphylococcus succinus]
MKLKRIVALVLIGAFALAGCEDGEEKTPKKEALDKISMNLFILNS